MISGSAPFRVLFVVNHAGFFLTHRLHLARAAVVAGYDVHVATPESRHVPAIESAGLPWHPIRLTRSGRNPIGELRTIGSLIRLYRAPPRRPQQAIVDQHPGARYVAPEWYSRDLCAPFVLEDLYHVRHHRHHRRACHTRGRRAHERHARPPRPGRFRRLVLAWCRHRAPSPVDPRPLRRRPSTDGTRDAY